METRESEQTAPEVIVTLSDILFECPNCDKSMVIDESATGMTVECPQCHASVIVPPRPPPSVEGEQRETPDESLLLAAQKGDLAALNNALARGADANAANSDGMTALMFAVQQGSEDCVQTLISRGANLEARREDGQTAATLAQRANRFQILRLLWKVNGK
ncbi:MAG: ankyrin repeat domain-containing protein [Verrucomicrobiia bacterium]|jgi:DNA-directed RNA polymerase subunit RPC12/RpoP